jgi:tetratricopeptide (TPR) repeat protein
MAPFPSRGSPLGLRLTAWTVLAAFLAAARADPTPPDLRARAFACYEDQRYSEARRLFTALARERPGDPEIDFHLGRLALWFDDGAAAFIHLNRAVAATPDAARVHNALGDAHGWAAQHGPLLEKPGAARRCVAAYRRAVELEPGNIAWRWSLIGYFCVAPSLVGGGFAKAREQAAAIARLDPGSGRIARLTVALAERRFPAAFAECEAALREHPGDFVALYQFGRCAALSGLEIARGLEALRRCLALEPPRGPDQPTRACVHHRIGNLLEKSGDLAGARAAYEAARREHPDFRAEKIYLRN